MEGYQELKDNKPILTLMPYDNGQDRIVSEQGYYGLDWLLKNVSENSQIQFNNRNHEPVAFLLKKENKWEIVWEIVTDLRQKGFGNEFNNWENAFWFGVTYMDKRKDVPHAKEYERLKSNNVLVEYCYELKLRPFCNGTQPDDYVRFSESFNYGYGYVIYNRMLTDNEINHFSLEPASYSIIQ